MYYCCNAVTMPMPRLHFMVDYSSYDDDGYISMHRKLTNIIDETITMQTDR